MLVSTRNWAG